ncbi:MAG: hypothetical protein AAGC81_06595 [Pseudomonadota bacterium]
MMRTLFIALLLLGCSSVPPSDPLQGEPILFSLPSGEEVVVDRLIVLSPTGPQGAPVPKAARYVRNEDRIDLGGLPLLGPIFGGPRVTPGDAKRDGFPLGNVFHAGSALVVDLSRGDAGSLQLETTVATLIEPAQPIRYDLGRPAWRPVPAPQVARDPIGEAYLLSDRFVIVSEASLPGLEDYYDLLF